MAHVDRRPKSQLTSTPRAPKTDQSRQRPRGLGRSYVSCGHVGGVTTTSMEWFDFEQIYNGTGDTSTLEWVDQRVQCKGQTPNNVIAEVAPRTPNTVPTTDVGTMTAIDDFPFIQAKLYEPTAVTDIAVVTRSYEESFMTARGPPCANALECECMKAFADKERFIMRQFTLPSGEKLDTCILCLRMETLRLFIDARANSVIPQRTIQPYRNIVGVKGEYDIDDCISMEGELFHGVVDPFIFYTREHYRSIVYDGVRRVVQDMEDFRDGVHRGSRTP